MPYGLGYDTTPGLSVPASHRGGTGHAELVELLDGHGHWVMLEDPGRVASLVIPFLRRQLPGGEISSRVPMSCG